MDLPLPVEPAINKVEIIKSAAIHRPLNFTKARPKGEILDQLSLQKHSLKRQMSIAVGSKPEW